MKTFDLIPYLKDRFYITGGHRNNYTYYDTQAQEVIPGISHIYGVALTKLADNKVTYEAVKAVVDGVHYRSLMPSTKYRPNKASLFMLDDLWYRNEWVKPVFKETGFTLDAKNFIDHLTSALDRDTAYYVIDILAYRLQNPEGKKPAIAFYFYHEVGGMGKSLFVDTLRNVLGSNSVKTINTIKALGSMSTVELWKASWLAVEEAGVVKGSSTYDNLKSYIGGDTVDSDVKNKGFSTHEIPAMLMLMSNSAPTFIEPDDRRFLVKEWHIDFDCPTKKKEYFTSYVNWLENEGGYESIHQYLRLKNVSRDVWDEVPKTKEKVHAMSLGGSAVVTDLKDFLEDCPDKWYFNMAAFDGVFNAHHVSGESRKHRLTEAGLVIDTKRRVGEKQYRLWKRKGAFVNAGAGNKSVAHFEGAKKPLAEAAIVKRF